MQVCSILSQRGDRQRSSIPYKGDKHSVVHQKASREGVTYAISAVLDPLSNSAQKLASILKVLHKAFNVDLKIFMNCRDKLSEMPVKRFYQYVLQPELSFAEDGSLKNEHLARFFGLPASALLTLNMDTPQSWMIEASGSNMDLDNIHLAEVCQTFSWKGL